MNPKEKEQNRKLVEMFKDELGEVVQINLSENRVVEVRIWEDGKVRVSLCIGSETIWIDEEIKGQEYSISATDTTGGYPAGTFMFGEIAQLLFLQTFQKRALSEVYLVMRI